MLSIRRGAKAVLTAVIMVAMASGVSAADTRSSHKVFVKIGYAVAIAVDGSPVDLGNVSAVVQGPAQSKSVTVQSSGPWNLTIRSDVDRMKQVDQATGAYMASGATLANPLKCKLSTAQSFQDVGTQALTLISRDTPTAKAGETFSIQFQQPVDFGDVPPSNNAQYGIGITYEVSVKL